MLMFVEKYKNSEDILKENIKVMKKYITLHEEVGESGIKSYYPNCNYTIDEIKKALKNARKYVRNIKKGAVN